MDTGDEAARASGWYADPWVRGQRRYWTGSQWSADVFADGLHQEPDRGFAARYGAPPTDAADPAPAPPTWRHQVVAAPAPTPEAPPAPVPPSGPSQRIVAAIAVGLIAAVVLMAGAAMWVRSNVSRNEAAPAATASPRPSPSAPSPSAPATPSPSPSDESSRSSASQGSIEDALQALVLQQRDVPDRFRVAPIDGGRSVTDQPTLDLCEGAYPSESLRVGRLQVSARDGGDRTTLSTEAVQYSSTEATAQAFSEVQQVAAQCKGSMTLDLGTGAPVSTTVTEGADRGWHTTNGVLRQAYTVAETDMISGAESQQIVVYLRRGPLFMGLYFPNAAAKQMPVEGKTTIPEIVRIFEERLLSTPPGDMSQVPPQDSGPGPRPSDGGSGAIGA